MMPDTIRILADRSKDATGAIRFVSLEPRAEFQCTDNRERLKKSLLAQYDVLAICGQSLSRYTRSELAAIAQFVEAGGGLILAASAPIFEFSTVQPVAKMAENAVAGLLGAAFLAADCPGARVDSALRICLPQAAVKVRKNLSLGDGRAGLVTGGCAPISPPEGATILASYEGTGTPIAATFHAGDGRVAMVGARDFAAQREAVCRALARWAAPPPARRVQSHEPPPEYIGHRGNMKRHDHFHLTYDHGCADAVDEVLDLADKIATVFKRDFGEAWKAPHHIALLDTCSGPPLFWRSDALVGAQSPAASRAGHVIRGFLSRGMQGWGFYEAMDHVFSFAPWRMHVMIDMLQETGFEDEACRWRDRADRWLAEADGRALVFDLARSYPATEESCPRGLAVLRDLEVEHGKGLVRKLATTIPKQDHWKNLPPNYAWYSDMGIYYLSLAAGEDLFPWFARQGLTAHPLPIAKPGADNAKPRMMGRLGEAVRDEAEALSSRMDAATDLASMGAENDWGKDDWATLCSALKLSKQADGRATRSLSKLLAKSKPAALRAIAGLALADLGDASVADELISLARQFDPRFQLAAGYALAKAGSPRAGELALEGITGADGNPVGELEVTFDGYVTVHAKVAGYRVANVISHPAMHPFTGHATIGLHQVYWVHTSRAWRRRGLSRHAMRTTMDHPAAAKCSCSELGTGTRNVAHSLYRDHGFTDTSVHSMRVLLLPGRTALRPATGVTLREYAEGDRAKAPGFCQGECRHMFRMWGALRGELGASHIAYLAEREGTLLGFASAEYTGGDEATMMHLVVKEDDQRPSIADGLLALAHRAATDLGAKRVQWYDPPEEDYVREALDGAGYATTKSGGVLMLQVRDLRQFLREIAPLIRTRLAESDFKQWEGTIDLLAPRLTGRVKVTKRKVTAGEPTDRPADIRLICDDDTATRVVLGCETPFEAYLQTRLTIEPRVSESITKLLEVVFPCVKC